MRKLMMAAIVGCLISSWPIQTICAASLLIYNANLINPIGQIKPKLGYIFIQHDKIQKIGYGKIALPNNMPTLNAKQQFIIPGLIDSHVHIDTILGMPNDNQQHDLS